MMIEFLSDCADIFAAVFSVAVREVEFFQFCAALLVFLAGLGFFRMLYKTLRKG